VLKHHGMKMYGAAKVQLHIFLTWPQEIGNLHALAILFPRKKSSVPDVYELCGAHSMNGHGGKEGNSCPYQELNSTGSHH
jgi:hypothetical protein